MNNESKSIQIQTLSTKQFNTLDYSDNIKQRNNNSYLRSFNFKQENNDIKTYNSSLINERKPKLNSIKFNFRKKISLKKPQLSKLRNYLYNDKSPKEQKKVKEKNPILHLSANFEDNKDNINISFHNKILKKIRFKNPYFDIGDNNPINDINLNLGKRLKSGRVFHNFGANFLSKNKYFSDFVNSEMNKDEENKKCEKKDWENVEDTDKEIDKEDEKICNEDNMENKDIKIEKLAKELNLFQNDSHFYNLNLKKNNSFANLIKNLKLPEENINRMNNINENVSPISRISTRIPSSRINSGKIINNNYNNVNINRLNFDKYKINNIIDNTNKKNESLQSNEYEYYIEGTNILSPFCEKARDLFLYKKIFYYFGQKKIPKIMKRFLNNKLNICYAENEEQFDEKIRKQNLEKIQKGVGKILPVGKSEQEQKSDSICHKVGFIKKVFDYAYPDILIYKIKRKSKMQKNKIKENSLKNLLNKKDLNDELKRKFNLKKYRLLNSIKIEKINM